MRSGILSSLLMVAAAGSALLFAPGAFAQTDDAPKADDASGAAAAGDATPADDAKPAADAPAAKSDKADQSGAIADAEAAGSPVELPGKTYRFVGLRYHAYVVPKFMENMFGADGGRTVVVNDFGPEFAIRKDGFEYIFALTYADYGMDPTPFKSSSDPDTAWEIVESKIKMIQLTTDFLWSQEFSPEFSMNYGMGAGLGIVFGDLLRTQSYPGGATDPANYKPCIGVGNPDPNYCGNDNSHYNGYKEPSWANGGSKPIVFPLLMAELGLRYKPHKNFVGRLDMGFGTSGFVIGLGADYGL